MIAFLFFKDYTPVSLSHFQDILREKNTSFNILHEPGIRVYVIILSKTMNSVDFMGVSKTLTPRVHCQKDIF